MHAEPASRMQAILDQINPGWKAQPYRYIDIRFTPEEAFAIQKMAEESGLDTIERLRAYIGDRTTMNEPFAVILIGMLAASASAQAFPLAERIWAQILEERCGTQGRASAPPPGLFVAAEAPGSMADDTNAARSGNSEARPQRHELAGSNVSKPGQTPLQER